MVKYLIFGFLALSAVTAQAQVMTDAYVVAPQATQQVSSGPVAGQPYFDAGNQCNTNCDDSCRQCADCCRYFKSFGGFTELGDYVNTNGPSQATGTFQDGYCVGGAIGRKLRPMVNAEVEFAYRNNEGDEWAVFNPQLNGTTTQPWDGDITCYSGMTNFLLEGCRRVGGMSPYAGAGAGFGFVDGELSTQAADYVIDDSGFAFQFIAGISTACTCNADLFVEYRYFAVEDLHVDQVALTAPPVDFGDFDYRTHNVLFGLRLCH
jgi:opacity protein-like surface antigen